MKFVCPHNAEVDCELRECDRCGWNPPVAKARLKAITDCKKFIVPFTGYSEVWARTPEEAVEKTDNEEAFFIHFEYGDPICEEDENEME